MAIHPTLATLLFCAACPFSTGASDEGAPVTKAASATPTPGGEEVVREFVTLVDRGCACADPECVSKVQDERRAFGETHRDVAFTPEQGARIDAEERRLRACRSARPPAGPVAADGLEDDETTAAEVRAFIRQHLGALRSCWTDRRREAPDIAGKLSYRMTVATTGAVTTVEVISDTLGDDSVKRCTVAAIQGWRLSATAGAEEPADITFSVDFSDP